MLTPEIPSFEPERLKALEFLCLLDTQAEHRFDRLTQFFCRLFDVPLALLSLVDHNRQWFKSRQGLDARETAREISSCGHTLLSEHILYVPNASEDERFQDNPLVIGPPNIRFYMGGPLQTLDGFRIGTLCLIETKAREIPNNDFHLLRDMADIVETELNHTALITGDFHWNDKIFELYGIEPEQFSGSYEAWSQAIYKDDLNSRSSEKVTSILMKSKSRNEETLSTISDLLETFSKKVTNL